MIDFSVILEDFPALSGRKVVTWAPVFISPISGSPERLVVGVAVADERGGVVCVASGLDRLHCLYGQASNIVVAAARSAISELENQLAHHGHLVLIERKFSNDLVFTGDPTQSTAKEMRGLANLWLQSISSLHISNEGFALEVPSTPGKIERARGDRLPNEVLRIASESKSPVLQYFTRAASRSGSRTPLASVSLDFKGKRLAANFSTLRLMPNMRTEFDRILRRLWALDVNQVRSGHSKSDAFQYELILQKPNLSDFADDGRKVALALDELASQADEKNLRLRQFANAKEVIAHLERREAA